MVCARKSILIRNRIIVEEVFYFLTEFTKVCFIRRLFESNYPCSGLAKHYRLFAACITSTSSLSVKHKGISGVFSCTISCCAYSHRIRSGIRRRFRIFIDLWRGINCERNAWRRYLEWSCYDSYNVFSMLMPSDVGLMQLPRRSCYVPWQICRVWNIFQRLCSLPSSTYLPAIYGVQ